MNFQPVAFIDPSYCTAIYLTKYREKMASADDGWLKIILRQDGKDYPILSGWKSARVLISKVRNAPAPLLDGKPVTLSSAAFVALEPQGRIEWREPEGPGLTAYLPMVPSPSVMMFSGIEAHNAPVGQLTLVSRAHPFSAINLGSNTALWLRVDAEPAPQE